MKVEYLCLNCGDKIFDTPSRQRKFCSGRCRGEYVKKHGLSKENKEHLSMSASIWWSKIKEDNPEYISWRRERVKDALKKIPDIKHTQRYNKISVALKGRKPVNTGVRTGEYINCLQCHNKFYRVPSSSTKFCCRECWKIYNKEHWRELHPKSNTYLYKETVKNERGGKCEACGFSDSRILTVHHKDGNRKHNIRENLLILCPNCHFVLHINGNDKVDFRKVLKE